MGEIASNRLIIVGASGHARVILDAARCGGWTVLGFIDATHAPGELVDETPVLGNDADVPTLLDRFPDAAIILGIGDNAVRRRIAEAICQTDSRVRFAKVIHPCSVVARDVQIEDGCFIAAGVTVNTGCKIGSHVVLNTNSSVDHDCTISDFAFIGPNAALAGGVELDVSAFVGIGATIIQNIKIGKHAVVGAGAVVLSEVSEGERWVGVPARAI